MRYEDVPAQPTTTPPSTQTSNLVGELMVTQHEPPYGSKAIGRYIKKRPIIENNLKAKTTSEGERFLQHIYDEIGQKVVTRRILSFSPPWILDQAFSQEYSAKWHGSHTLEK